jgi:hypothetical protein
MQEFEGKEQVIFYLSRKLLDPDEVLSRGNVVLVPIFIMHQIMTLFVYYGI